MSFGGRMRRIRYFPSRLSSSEPKIPAKGRRGSCRLRMDVAIELALQKGYVVLQPNEQFTLCDALSLPLRTSPPNRALTIVERSQTQVSPSLSAALQDSQVTR